jgi:hypothetical protein
MAKLACLAWLALAHWRGWALRRGAVAALLGTQVWVVAAAAALQAPGVAAQLVSNVLGGLVAALALWAFMPLLDKVRGSCCTAVPVCAAWGSVLLGSVVVTLMHVVLPAACFYYFTCACPC